MPLSMLLVELRCILGDENMNQHKRPLPYKKWLLTFSKKAVVIILAVSLVDLQLSYILAFLGKDQIAESLSSEIASVIIGVMIGYFMKALFETFFEKREERLNRSSQENESGE